MDSRLRRAALYVRVSTVDQDLAAQRAELERYSIARGWTVERVYAEKVSASGRVAREQHEKLLADAVAPRRTFGRVVVWSIDRWSRDPSFVRAIGTVEELEKRGLLFHSVREPTLDTPEDGSPSLARDLLRGILPAISAFEARRRSERTQLAMDEIRSGRRPTRTGNPLGRPRRVTPEKEAAIRELRYVQRRPWAEVAMAVHLPTGTCRKVRPNPVLEIPHAGKGQDDFRAPAGPSGAESQRA